MATILYYKSGYMSNRNAKIFCENLRHARRRLGLNQTELAERLGATASFVSHLEKGSRQPSIEMLIKLSRVLGQSVDSLLGLSDQPDPLAGQSERLWKALQSLTKQDVEALATMAEALAAKRK